MRITLIILKRGWKAQNEKCETQSAKCEMKVAIVTANVDVMSVCICLPPSLYLRSSLPQPPSILLRSTVSETLPAILPRYK